MQFLSGHENLKAKLHCFRISDDAWCEICEVDTEKTACVCSCNAMPFAMKKSRRRRSFVDEHWRGQNISMRLEHM